jgi:AraC-like DNA-binding protein
VRASPQQPLHVPAPTAPALRAVCAILLADPAEDRSLAALGRLTGASDRTLSRLFRADLGMTFPQWRTQVRLSHALVLLAEGTPVTVVAHRCGWSSASAFIDAFRRAFGHTPGRGPAGDGHETTGSAAMASAMAASERSRSSISPAR